jgi:hypothetical protein
MFFPVWCLDCGEEKREVRKESGVVEWRCSCPDGSRIHDMLRHAFPRRFEPSPPLPFRPDCNLRFSVTSPGVLQNILATSVHLTPRYAIEQMKAAGVGYVRQIGRAVFVETHVNTAMAFFSNQREQSCANHLAKSSNANLLIPMNTDISSKTCHAFTVCGSVSAK